MRLKPKKRSAFGIFFDNSGSLRTRIETEIELAKEIVRQVGGHGPISLFGFVTDNSTKTPMAKFAASIQCSYDRDLINKQIENIYTVGGQTTLVDAIKNAAITLQAADISKCGDFAERSLILITDGEDRASVTKLADLVSTLKQNGTKVFAIGLLNEPSVDSGIFRNPSSGKSKELLKVITVGTGGKVVFPEKNKVSMKS